MGFIMPIQSYILIEMGDKNLNQTNVRTTKGQGGVYIDYSVVTSIILHWGYLLKQCAHLNYSAQGISNKTVVTSVILYWGYLLKRCGYLNYSAQGISTKTV